VIATDSNGVASAGQSLTLTINAPPLSITTNACNVRRSTAMQGFALGASGGTPPYVWSAPGKPAWISLTAGTLTGTAPATTGALPFTLTVTDADSASASTTFTVTVTNNNPGNPRC
jgi:hypothetical protein